MPEIKINQFFIQNSQIQTNGWYGNHSFAAWRNYHIRQWGILALPIDGLPFNKEEEKEIRKALRQAWKNHKEEK